MTVVVCIWRACAAPSARLSTSVRKISRLSCHLLLWVAGVTDGVLVIVLTVGSLGASPAGAAGMSCQKTFSCDHGSGPCTLG